MTNTQQTGTFSRLMASTPTTHPEAEILQASPSEPVSESKRVRARTHAPTQANTRVSTNTRTSARTHAPDIEELYRQIQTKQHLASSTFRFRSEELHELDAVSEAIKGGLSKNDIVRLGLNVLLRDYKENGGESVLAKVRKRT